MNRYLNIMPGSGSGTSASSNTQPQAVFNSNSSGSGTMNGIQTAQSHLPPITTSRGEVATTVALTVLDILEQAGKLIPFVPVLEGISAILKKLINIRQVRTLAFFFREFGD